MYLTIQNIPPPNHHLLDDLFALLRFAKWTPNSRFGDLLKTTNSWFPLHLERPSGSRWNAQLMFSLLRKKAPLLQSTTVFCSARAFIYKSNKAALIDFVLITHIPSQMWKYMTNLHRSESDALNRQCGSLYFTKLTRNSLCRMNEK